MCEQRKSDHQEIKKRQSQAYILITWYPDNLHLASIADIIVKRNE